MLANVNGANPDLQNNHQRSPLNTAAPRSKGHLDVVKLLVDRGADLSTGTQGKWGTPLREAIDAKRRAVAEYLRSKGARE